MTPGPGRRKWFWYLRPGPGGMPLALRLSEGLDRTRHAAKSEHLWIVASSFRSASLAMAVS
jgi:hypothetical protein